MLRINISLVFLVIAPHSVRQLYETSRMNGAFLMVSRTAIAV